MKFITFILQLLSRIFTRISGPREPQQSLPKKDPRFNGAIPSPQDDRDYRVAAAVPIEDETLLPNEFEVSYKIDHIYDQGNTGMCVAYSLKRIKEVQELKNQKKYIPMSAGFIYNNRELMDESLTLTSEGMIMREALLHLVKEGVCKEELFNWKGFWVEVKNKPSLITSTMIEDAKNYKISQFVKAETRIEMKSALMQLGPLIAGIPVTGKLIGGYNELITMEWALQPWNYYGGHAVVIVGWKRYNGINYWTCINSWGKDWGDFGGYFYLPFNYPMFEVWSLTDVDFIVPENVPVPEKPKYWRVQVGAFGVKNNAYNMQAALKAKGYATYIVFVNGLYKVQTGAFSVKENALNLEAKLKAQGFPTYVVYY